MEEGGARLEETGSAGAGGAGTGATATAPAEMFEAVRTGAAVGTSAGNLAAAQTLQWLS